MKSHEYVNNLRSVYNLVLIEIFDLYNRFDWIKILYLLYFLIRNYHLFDLIIAHEQYRCRAHYFHTCGLESLVEATQAFFLVHLLHEVSNAAIHVLVLGTIQLHSLSHHVDWVARCDGHQA